MKLYVMLADVAFVGFAVLMLLGGVVAVGARQLIHAVIGLATCMVGVAGIYVYLGTHFIAAMQILIYVGAVCVSLIFAVMLARPPKEMEEKSMRFGHKIAMGAITALFATLVLGTTVTSHPWKAAEKVLVEGTIMQVGEGLLTKYALVFELISVVLLVAIMGSVVLARRGRGTPGAGEGEG